MIKPTPRLLAVITIIWFIALIEFFMLQSATISAIITCSFGLAIFCDYWLSRNHGKQLKVQRSISNTLSIGVPTHVTLTLRNLSNTTIHTNLYDHFPGQYEAPRHSGSILLNPGQVGECTYEVTPTERGAASFTQVDLVHPSIFHFWHKQHTISLVNDVKIYPNYSEVIKYGILAAKHNLSGLGIHAKRQRGEGTDFHQLREFRQGDRLSTIDWKATARMNKIISRQFQIERDQQIILMLDCSKNMSSRDGELSHFDHAVNALLLLTYVAIRQGDAVGLMTYGGPNRWLKPSKSPQTVNKFLEALYDVYPTDKPADYMEAAVNCAKLIKKRALIVNISNLREESSSELLLALLQLKQRHLVMFAGLHEQVLQDALLEKVRSEKDALTYASTREYLHSRQKTFDQLAQRGVDYLDITPKELPTALVNYYQALKSSGNF